MLPHSWDELVALLDQGPEVDPMTRVQRLCALCAQVSGVAGVALSVSTDHTRFTVCATDDLSDRLEDLQDTLSEGPSFEALQYGQSRFIPDLAASGSRWPGFTPAAAEEGVRAMFVFPLRMGAARLGALTLHRPDPGALDDAQFRDAWVLADAAAVLLLLSSPEGKPSDAFSWVLGDRSRFRPEVHQAVGATMVHLGVDPREAFARICAHAFATATPIGMVAAEIIANRLRLEMDLAD